MLNPLGATQAAKKDAFLITYISLPLSLNKENVCIYVYVYSHTVHLYVCMYVQTVILHCPLMLAEPGCEENKTVMIVLCEQAFVILYLLLHRSEKSLKKNRK